MRLVFAGFCFFLAVLFGQGGEPKPGKIEGRVVHAVTGAGVPRVALTLASIVMPTGGAGGTVTVAGFFGGATASSNSVTSGPDGSFSFTNLAPGSYMLRGERNGFLAASYSASPQSPSLRVAAGQEITGITLKLAPQSIVVVKVLDENAEPVNRAMVQVMRNRFSGGQRLLLPMGGGQTNDLGEYRASVGAGTYYVSAMAGPMGMMNVSQRKQGQTEDEIPVATYYPSATDRGEATPITLGVGQEMPITIQVRKGRAFRVRGTVPVDLARSQLMMQPRSRDLNIGTMIRPGTQVRPDGSFEFVGVVPGSYIITASRTGVNTMPTAAARAVVDVGNGDVDGVALQPVQAVTLKGRVTAVGLTDKDRVNFAGMRVMASPIDAMGGFMGAPPTIQPDGTFTIEGVSQGRYQLRLASGMTGYLKSIRFGQLDVTTTGIDLTGITEPPPIEMIFSGKAATLTVNVTLPSPEGSPGMVLLYPDSSQPALPTDQGVLAMPVTPTGVARMPSLPPGKYHVYALETYDPLDGIDPEVLKRVESKGTGITVSEGETATVTVKQLTRADLETH